MFRILVVCTANICRSPATATLLRRELAPLVSAGMIEITSAGVAADAGRPACDLSSALVGQFVARQHPGEPAAAPDPDAHVARRVTVEMVDQADLILALDRSHRSQLARVSAAARPRTFTLRQAAGLSQVIDGYLSNGELPPGAPALPPQSEAALRWLVGELDAARGTPVGANETNEAMQWHEDDVPDPHVMGYQIHGAAIELAEAAVLILSSVMGRVVAESTEETTSDRP